jgi:hypothetical protein
VVVKGESNPRYLVYEIISQRKQVEIACTSKHPYEVRYRQKDGIAGAGLSNIWTLIVDVGAHLPNIPFTVDLRVVRFNAYQAPNKNWVGVKVEDHEEVVKTHVILPRNHVLATSDLKVVSREVSSTSEAEFSGSNILPSPDSKSFTWTITKPEIGVIYKVYIDWEKNP